MSGSKQDLGNLVIRASAGTGKTFQLVHRYLALLHSGASPDRVLASTFTRKASGEILDRVVGRLASAVVDPETCRDVARFIHDEDLSQQDCAEMLRHLLGQLYRLRISTLDSLFIQMTRSMSLELGVPPSWRIMDEREDASLRGEALESLFQLDSTADLLTLTHLLTKGEASRGIGDLVRDAISDMYELFLETDEAAWHALPRHTPLDDGQVAGAMEALREVEISGKSFAKAREADCLRALHQDWEAFVGTGVAAKVAAKEEKYGRQVIPEELVQAYRPLVEHARALLIGRIAQQTSASYELLRSFDVEYQRIKLQHRAMRFVDVTWRLAHAAMHATDSSGTEMGRLAFRLDGHIDHVLLDEFQDTSPPQWHAIRRMVERVTSKESSSFFCVGDVKQAIYGWRGGLAEIFDAVSEQLPNIEHQSLNTSFRSSQAVIDSVNQIFTGITKHENLERTEPAVRTFVHRFEEHETALTQLPGYVCLSTAPQDGDSDAKEMMLDFAVKRIGQLHAATPTASIGVLVRTNATVAKIIGRLRQLDVLASEEGGNPLTDAASVQIVLSLLRLTDHPGNRVARFHVATSPLATALGFTEFQDEQATDRVAQEVRHQLVDEGYGPAVARWARIVGQDLDARQQSRLEQLVELAFVYGASPTIRTMDFVEFIEQERVSDPASANVRVMTIHQAKGLEFDIVVLPELNANLTGQAASFVVRRSESTRPADRVCRYVNENTLRLFPKSVQEMFARATHRRVSESLCLLYVAVTRARHTLYMLIDPSKPNEKKVPRTFGGLLRVALVGNDPIAPDQLVYEHGQADWYQHTEEQPAASEGDQAEPRLVLPNEIVLGSDMDGQRHSLSRTSPSAMEGGNRIRHDRLWQTPNREALLRGTIVHAFFERIRWLEDGLPDKATLRAVGECLLRTDAAPPTLDLEELIEQFFSDLAKPAAVQLLQRERYLAALHTVLPGLQPKESETLEVQVHNERPFAIREQNRMLTGNIDRLVFLSRGRALVAAEVVDFKTDVIRLDSQLVERIDFYRPQIDAYRRAVAAITGLAMERIAARLLFVNAGEVRPV
ncbi:MAG TPA: UvrD-helicase domain-containing protein [Pirellulaceae bacterium]|nr:UvrD-helicase domain-containing protein [Pirellulaceae bacterium]